MGATLPLWSVLPFAGILLSIALFPLLAPHFWHRHYGKVSACWALVFALPFLAVFRAEAWHEIVHIALVDYLPFIILLWGLFTVAGGIVIRGAPRGTPAANTAMLLAGTLLASWVGTTGAAMVTIRPVLRANAHRQHKVHTVVFFIFLVANIGGSLTPLGDPPLFLGFLHGVPFFWTLRMIGPMSVAVALLVAAYYVIDRYYSRMERGTGTGTETVATDAREAAPAGRSRIQVAGAHNFVFLGGIVGAVLLSGLWHAGEVGVLGVHIGIQDLVRDALIVLMGVVSLVTTRVALRRENEFGWGPIQEVAYLFAGIFITIIPALAILKAGENGHLAWLVRSVETPAQFFWATGTLSSFLDNAPTYLTFLNTALGRFAPGLPELDAIHQLIAREGRHLLAISAGAVFMGANTYIGNAPNFMVKSIAEEAGIAMPSFFGFLVRWTLPFMVPTLVIVTLVFFM